MEGHSLDGVVGDLHDAGPAALAAHGDLLLAQLSAAGSLDAGAIPMAQTYRALIQCEVLRELVFAGERVPTFMGDPAPWMSLQIEALRCLAEEQRRNWLRRTLANIAVNGFRREAAFRDRLPRIEALYRKFQADPPEQAFSSIALERCWRIIQGLPERQHAVALLRWGLDMKEAEIAAVLDMSEKTVSVHLHRVRRRLITQLGPDYPFTDDDAEGASA